MGKVIAIVQVRQREHRRQESKKAHLLKILVWKEMHMQENGIVRSVFFLMIRSRHSVREVQK